MLTTYTPVNICIAEPSGVSTNFEGHSKVRTAAHPAYAGEDMPARRLEAYVNKGIAAGAAAGMIAPETIADALWTIASRGEKVPLRLPLGATSWRMAKMWWEGLVGDLENVKSVSGLGTEL
jgi:hypothetical protein